LLRIAKGKLEMKLKAWSLALLGAMAMLALAASAGAVDGTIEINQAKVLASGGFPYVISTSGSYKLTGSLTVPASTNGINVTANNVTIDMNGFLITGSGSTSGLINGVSASGIADVTVENGTITGMGLAIVLGKSGIVRNVHADINGFGIDVGDNSVVEGCTASNSSTAYGISCSSGCSITGNTANGNGDEGLFCSGSGCQITGNTANGNNGVGIECQNNACVISGNTVLSNPTLGIGCFGTGCLISGNVISNSATGVESSDTTTGYSNNVLKNTSNFVSGKSLGNNLCSGTVC
jgi:parallel beta-helix repeat protein